MSTPTLLAAKPVSLTLRNQITERVTRFQERAKRTPKLIVILVGNDPASEIYTSKKGQAAERVGMSHKTITFPENVTPQEVKALCEQLSTDPSVDGILIQRPLPKQFTEEEVIYWIAPSKDVDGFHPENIGKMSLGISCHLPCTPKGIMALLKHYQIQLEGKLACVIGRSSLVGKPIAALLMQANATVIQCHSRTQDLPSLTRQADLLVVAAGKKRLISKEHLKKGAVVIDVGIHREEGGSLCGDVDFESASELASQITPVPGGVGPMTITMLLENTIQSAEESLQNA